MATRVHVTRAPVNDILPRKAKIMQSVIYSFHSVNRQGVNYLITYIPDA